MFTHIFVQSLHILNIHNTRSEYIQGVPKYRVRIIVFRLLPTAGCILWISSQVIPQSIQPGGFSDIQAHQH